MNLKKILSSVAPFIGAMIGGPFGAAAAKIAGKVLLDNENATEKEVEKALISAAPEKLIELRKASADYEIKMAELGIDSEKISALDRDSARKREIATGDKMPAALAIMLTLGFFGTLASVMLLTIPAEAQGAVNIMLGSEATAWAGMIAYYFGSSSGSKQKTNMLSNHTN